MKYPELVVMLTYNDTTVEQAFRIFEECRQTDAKYWGFKEKPLPMEQMKELAGYMKACGKTTFLEVVAYNEEECLEGAKAAAECQVDYLMGTLFYDSVNDLCRENGIRYMPFVGRVTGRPFANGTSVSYSNIDFRFANNTDQDFQIVIGTSGEMLCAQLRCEHPYPYTYRLAEEGHHFQKEGDKYYRVSTIYHETYDKETGELLKRELILDNHSQVMYAPDLIVGEITE